MKATKKVFLLLSVFLTLCNKIYTENNKYSSEIIFEDIENDEQLNVIDQSEEALPNSIYGDLIHEGRVILENQKGYIYTVLDPVDTELKLNIIAKKEIIGNNNGNLSEMEFFVYNNYSNFIEKWELFIYDNLDRREQNLLKVFKGDYLDETQSIITDMSGIDNENLIYVLRVYDKNGSFDETVPKKITLSNDKLTIKSKENSLETIWGLDNRNKKNIVVDGANVRIVGKELASIKKIKIGEKEIFPDRNNNLLIENFYFSGEHFIPITVQDKSGTEYGYVLSVNVPKDYQFLVGIADFSFNKNKVSGNNEILKNNEEYDDYFNSGRLAFYYKRLIDGYKITAQADTWNNEIKDIFRDIHRRDARSYFRKIDYDYLKFNYGDDSILLSDVDTQGKAYLRVEKDKSNFIWGNYNTGITGTEYGQYNRTLYGARAEYNSLDENYFGDTKIYMSAFASEPDTAFAHDEFLGTGGSFYYLNRRDIVVGSAKVYVEVKDPKSGRVLSRNPLIEGKDYDINELNGLIILQNPLSQIVFETMSDRIIQDGPLYGDNSHLVVDYEYYTENTEILTNNVYGARVKNWISDNVALGGTFVKENRDVVNYELKGVDITLKKSESTYLMGEYFQSKGNQTSEETISFNGGLDFFEEREDIQDINLKGDAYKIEAGLKLSDILGGSLNSGYLDTWYSKKEKGFSIAGDSGDTEKENLGLNVNYKISENLGVRLKGQKYVEKNIDDKIVEENDEIGAELDYKINEKWSLGTEVKHVKEKLGSNYSSLEEPLLEEDEIGKATLLGAKVQYNIDSNNAIYGKAQTTLDKSGGYESNNLYSLGTHLQLTENIDFNGETSLGDRGHGIDAVLGYNVTKDYGLYLGYLYNNEEFNKGGTATFGQKFRYDDRTNLYQENQFINSNKGTGFTQGYGIDYKYNERIWLGALVEDGELKNNGDKLRRTSTSLQLHYDNNSYSSKHKIEYMRDRGTGIDDDEDVIGTTNKLKWLYDKEYTFFGVGNFLYGKNKDNREVDSRYAEFGLGTAYRPIWNDKLNLIGKYTYLYDLGSLGQINTNAGEKAHILSLEGIYQINQRLDMGIKYAWRKEKARATRDSGQWFDSTLDLLAFRVNYEIVQKWDILGEYRWLRDIQENQIKHGAIVGVYRELQENIQVGVGYNFTEFDDDLTNLDYKAKGWFVNIIGKF